MRRRETWPTYWRRGVTGNKCFLDWRTRYKQLFKWIKDEEELEILLIMCLLMQMTSLFGLFMLDMWRAIVKCRRKARQTGHFLWFQCVIKESRNVVCIDLLTDIEKRYNPPNYWPTPLKKVVCIEGSLVCWWCYLKIWVMIYCMENWLLWQGHIGR